MLFLCFDSLNELIFLNEKSIASYGIDSIIGAELQCCNMVSEEYQTHLLRDKTIARKSLSDLGKLSRIYKPKLEDIINKFPIYKTLVFVFTFIF